MNIRPAIVTTCVSRWQQYSPPIHGLGIVYRGVPASYEAVGQRITMPDQVVATKIANCIELTLLMATVLEAIGINCVIIFQKGHAYLGVWLVNDCYPCSVCDDPSYIEKMFVWHRRDACD